MTADAGGTTAGEILPRLGSRAPSRKRLTAGSDLQLQGVSHTPHPTLAASSGPQETHPVNIQSWARWDEQGIGTVVSSGAEDALGGGAVVRPGRPPPDLTLSCRTPTGPGGQRGSPRSPQPQLPHADSTGLQLPPVDVPEEGAGAEPITGAVPEPQAPLRVLLQQRQIGRASCRERVSSPV